VSAVDVVLAFNERINARDLAGLVALMTDDHRFVDATGASADGREACTEAWRGFFESFPDYRNEFDEVVAGDDGAVHVLGRSYCCVPALDGPARWRAVTRGARLAEWRVLDD
jgi:ketosteroid isomerase-like protein